MDSTAELFQILSRIRIRNLLSIYKFDPNEKFIGKRTIDDLQPELTEMRKAGLIAMRENEYVPSLQYKIEITEWGEMVLHRFKDFLQF
jgi:hypothetical protein